MCRCALRVGPPILTKRIRSIAIGLASNEIWLVAFAVAISVLWIRALPVAVAVATSFWMVRWLAYGRPSVHTPADWSIVLLILLLPITLYITSFPDITRVQVLRLVSGVLLYYAIANWATSPARLRLLFFGAMLIGLVLSLVAPITVVPPGGQKFAFIPAALYTKFALVVSDTINAAVLAGTLVLLVPCAIAVLLFGWRQLQHYERGVVGATTLVMLSMLILMQSRSGFIALAAMLGLMVCLRWRRGWLVLLASASVIGALVQSPAVITFLGASISFTARTFGGFEQRLVIWSRAVYMIQDYPFTGIGMGSFKQMIDSLYPVFFNSSQVVHAHNLLLQVAVDLGIPGLIAWLAIVTGVTAWGWQVYRHGCLMGDGWIAGLGAGLLCSQLALIVNGLTDAVTWGMVRPAVVPWALWGLSAACWNVYVRGSDHHGSTGESNAATAPADLMLGAQSDGQGT